MSNRVTWLQCERLDGLFAGIPIRPVVETEEIVNE